MKKKVISISYILIIILVMVSGDIYLVKKVYETTYEDYCNNHVNTYYCEVKNIKTENVIKNGSTDIQKIIVADINEKNIKDCEVSIGDDIEIEPGDQVMLNVEKGSTVRITYIKPDSKNAKDLIYTNTYNDYNYYLKRVSITDVFFVTITEIIFLILIVGIIKFLKPEKNEKRGEKNESNKYVK